ncbi:MAG: ATP-binding cassette domain-containing protein [Bifidobacteriaceae bacterium]|nr:ATP-binding cassette domain-containing protein [Bifidobacteriaceae bacterium]
MPDDDAPKNSAVVADGVGKAFGATVALRDVSFVVPWGAVYGVLGPNGAGKSTLLRSLLGLVRTDSGTVSILGRCPGDRETLLRTGALIERPAFLPALSARQNLRALARAKGLVEDDVDRALAVVDLVDKQDQAFRTYSLGMGQRLGLAAAVLGTPELLILDEPTSGLDPEGVLAVRQLIRDKAAVGATVVLSSHVLSEVEKVCDRVLVLRRGKVLAEGALTDVLSQQSRATALIEASPGTLARDLLVDRGLVDPGSPIPDDLRWRLAIEATELHALVHDLVLAGVSVHRAEPAPTRLEEVFLSMTLGAETTS